ncbi:hypothetical protein BD289DRAFT_483105 [Coniella lustricola]|uniref:Protein kinase domain-containing protein n=1 Tax=Coniella lustricola TaxID=2025994 RepID=A0A2T3A6M1_9PEZI|nr:hypothetical protein BD289DRAFT_483105 [Coniella lustricola]
MDVAAPYNMGPKDTNSLPFTPREPKEGGEEEGRQERTEATTLEQKQRATLARQTRLRSVILEVQVMRHPPLQAHANIPAVFGYGWSRQDGIVDGSIEDTGTTAAIAPFIVMEYAPHGTLRSYLKSGAGQISPSDHHSATTACAEPNSKKQQHQRQIPLRDIEILLGNVASGLAALHSCGIVHGDVKLDNVLVYPSRENPAQAMAKVSDFGHVVVLNGGGTGWYLGTAVYNAPEVQHQAANPLSPAELIKSDIWAFGLLVWEACLHGDEFWTRIPGMRTPTPSSKPSSLPGMSASTGDVVSLDAAATIQHDDTIGDNIKNVNDDDQQQLDLPAPNCSIKNNGLLRDLAKLAIPGSKHSLGIAMFLRVTLNMTLQEDPAKRAASARELPLFTRWNAGGLAGVAADIALHLATPVPTYEMFRLDNGRDIPWPHQQQIFQGLLQALQTTRTETSFTNYSNPSPTNNHHNHTALAWQIALCHYHGFGTQQNTPGAHRFARLAAVNQVGDDDALGIDNNSPKPPASPARQWQRQHPLAAVFADVFAPVPRLEGTYTERIVDLLRSSDADADADTARNLPPLVRACFDGDASRVLQLLKQGASPNTSTIDGSSLFHWLFMVPDTDNDNNDDDSPLKRLVSALQRYDLPRLEPGEVEHVRDKDTGRRLLVNAPSNLPREIHAQWPLQLLGSPLAVALSVNSAAGVRTLLHLGADPLGPAYFCSATTTDVDPTGHLDNKMPTFVCWTSLHIAAKYHNSELLTLLIDQAIARHDEHRLAQLSPPLASALSFSTTLERTVMYGSAAGDKLHETLCIIREWQNLDAAEPKGMTPLMRAIDCQDTAVVAALLDVEPGLAMMPMRAPGRESELYNYPVHFAVQIAARRDADDTLAIPRIILNTSVNLLPAEMDDEVVVLPPRSPLLLRDHLGRTPLHMAVTGSSDRAARWIFDETAQNSYMLDMSNISSLHEAEDHQGQTALFYCKSAANARLLLDNGANIQHRSKNGMTALHQACLVGNLEVVKTILFLGEDKPSLNRVSNFSCNNPYGSPLHCAVINGSMELVVLLVDAGAPLEATDRKNNTALHVAVHLGRFGILRFLVSRAESAAPRGLKGATVDTPPAYHEGEDGGEAQQDWKDSDPSDFEWDVDATLASVRQTDELYFSGDSPGTVTAVNGFHDIPAPAYGTFDDRQHRMQLMDSLCAGLGAELAQHVKVTHQEPVGEQSINGTGSTGAPIDTAATIVALLMTEAVWQSPRVDDLYDVVRHTGALLKSHLGAIVSDNGNQKDDMLGDSVAGWIAHILAQTRPADAFPGRSEQNIKAMVQGELNMARFSHDSSESVPEFLTMCSAQAARLVSEWQNWRDIQEAAAAATPIAKEKKGEEVDPWADFTFLRNGEQVQQVASQEDAWMRPSSAAVASMSLATGTPLEAQRWSR